MIQIKSLFKYYSNKFVKTYVLQDINLEIKQGEFVTIMGPSGSGKSTLLHIIGMLDEPNDGEYFFLDEPVHKFNE
ncbi:MAG: ATP-binding cassette domain-containing protein, partial [bacterium]